MIGFLKCTLSILNKNKNISKELKHEMICSIVALFFSDVFKCSTFLYNEEFINMVAEMTQNPELNIYLDQYKKSFFLYVKEQLLKVKDNKGLKNHLSIYLENRNRDLQINKLQKDKNNQERISHTERLNVQMSQSFSDMQNLQSTVNFYKWLYLFALIPVLGWIFCAILYFYFHKPCLDRLHQLVKLRQPCINELEKIYNKITEMELRYETLMQERTKSREQSEQLKHDCQILLNFIDPEEQMPTENKIIENKQKPLSENNIINIKKDP